MKKIGIVLAIFLLIGIVGAMHLPFILKSDKSLFGCIPSKESIDDRNAPVISQEQKDLAQKITEESDIFKKYSGFSRGKTTCVWAYPYSGTLHLSMIIGSPISDTYGLLWFDIDNKGVIQNYGFSDWINYW